MKSSRWQNGQKDAHEISPVEVLCEPRDRGLSSIASGIETRPRPFERLFLTFRERHPGNENLPEARKDVTEREFDFRPDDPRKSSTYTQEQERESGD
jgi:hypothetical protein